MVDLKGPSEFVIRTDEKNFELFKVLEEAKLAGGSPASRDDHSGVVDVSMRLRKYFIS